MLQDAGGQGIGFLLGSLSVQWALTSEACYKGLSKTASGEVVTFKGDYHTNTLLDFILFVCVWGCGWSVSFLWK